MNNLYYLLKYLVPVVVGIFTIFIGNWLSGIPKFLFERFGEPMLEKIYGPEELKIEKTKLFFTRTADGLIVSLLNGTLVYLLGFNKYILGLVFLAYLVKLSEPFNAYNYYELCNSEEEVYKNFVTKLKKFRFMGYLIPFLLGIPIGA